MKLFSLFLWKGVSFVYMSLYGIRTIIEISSQITIMQFISKSKFYLKLHTLQL